MDEEIQNMVRNMEIVLESVEHDLDRLNDPDTDMTVEDWKILYASCNERDELCNTLFTIVKSVMEE